MIRTPIEIGSFVRYARTGTTGTVVRIAVERGETFAELDSTGMLYREDLLTPTIRVEKDGPEGDTRQALKRIELDRDQMTEATDYEEALFQQDGACHGGG